MCMDVSDSKKKRKTYEDLRLMDLAQLFHAEWVELHASWRPKKTSLTRSHDIIQHIFLISLKYVATMSHGFTWWEKTCFCNKSIGSKSETILIYSISNKVSNLYIGPFIVVLFSMPLYLSAGLNTWYIQRGLGLVNQQAFTHLHIQFQWYDLCLKYYYTLNVLYKQICYINK